MDSFLSRLYVGVIEVKWDSEVPAYRSHNPHVVQIYRWLFSSVENPSLRGVGPRGLSFN